MKPASASTKMTGNTEQQSIKFGPITQLDSAQAAVLAEIKSVAFKKKLWPLSPLPSSFWTIPWPQDKLEAEGSHALRRLVFDRLPLQRSTVATQDEWQVVAQALLSPATFEALGAAIDHDDGCQDCPLHITATPVLNVKTSFILYIGAFLLSQEQGYLRFTPWFDRHFLPLAKRALAGIRPREPKKRSGEFEESSRCQKKRGKKPKDDWKRGVLSDTTNVQPTPPSPPAYVLDPSASISPRSCTTRRRERTETLREVKARGWAALPKPEEDLDTPGPDTEDPFQAPEATIPHRTAREVMSLSFIMNPE